MLSPVLEMFFFGMHDRLQLEGLRGIVSTCERTPRNASAKEEEKEGAMCD